MSLILWALVVVQPLPAAALALAHAACAPALALVPAACLVGETLQPSSWKKAEGRAQCEGKLE